MYARTEVHGHFEVNFYDPARLALVVHSTTIKGVFDPSADTLSVEESLQSQGYRLTGNKALLNHGEHSFVIEVAEQVREATFDKTDEAILLEIHPTRAKVTA